MRGKKPVCRGLHDEQQVGNAVKTTNWEFDHDGEQRSETISKQIYGVMGIKNIYLLYII